MRQILRFSSLLVLALCVSTLSTHAQTTNMSSNKTQPTCGQNGFGNLIAKYEYNEDTETFELADGAGVSIDDGSTATQGSWTSTTPVFAVIVKGSTDFDIINTGSASFSGSFDNSELENPGENTPDISNVQFCEPGACTASTFSEEVNMSDRTVTLEVTNNDRIDKVNFSTLVNFTVTHVSGGNVLSSANDIWDISGNPSSVTFKLTATSGASESRYFAKVTSDCDGGFVTFLDPRHDLSQLSATRPKLDGNAPNPFREQTRIRFTLPERADVNVTVYDVLGRRVASLVDRPLSAGSHEVIWDGRSSSGGLASSGLYFYRVEAGDIIQVRRMTLVR